MDSPPWLSDLLEFAELVLELGRRDDVERTLEKIETKEISLEEAVEELRRFRRS